MENTLADEIQQKALKWGADLIGFASVDRFKRYPPEHRPTHTFPEARTVIVLALNMVDPILDIWIQAPPTTGVGRSTIGRAFEDEILQTICYRLALFLQQCGVKSKVLGYEPGIYLKDAAVLAGLGVIGRNNLLITPQFGPRVRLRALAIDKELPSKSIMTDNSYCKDCDECVKACPVNALENGQFNRELCLTSSLHRRPISPYTTLWCTRCSCVCPVGQRVPCDDTIKIVMDNKVQTSE
ncbi:MAG: 4Fe-4S binding protein [Promethearchaeota archaeon]